MWNICFAYSTENTTIIDSTSNQKFAANVHLLIVQVSRVGKTWKWRYRRLLFLTARRRRHFLLMVIVLMAIDYPLWNTRNVLQQGSETRGSSHVLPKPLSEPVLTNHQWGLVGSPQYYPHGPSFGPSNLLLHDSNNSNSNNTDVFDEVYFGTVLLDTWFAKF